MTKLSGRLCVIGALVVALVSISTPAMAKPIPAPSPNPTYTFGGGSTDYSGGVDCGGYATAPHTSGGTLQWEGHIVCSATGTILLRINVYEVVGTGETSTRNGGTTLRSR